VVVLKVARMSSLPADLFLIKKLKPVDAFAGLPVVDLYALFAMMLFAVRTWLCLWARKEKILLGGSKVLDPMGLAEACIEHLSMELWVWLKEPTSHLPLDLRLGFACLEDVQFARRSLLTAASSLVLGELD